MCSSTKTITKGDTTMTNEKNKPHLIYMTGLSADKKRLNYITENIHFDKDYKYWYSYIDSLTSSALEQFQKFIDDHKKDIQENGVDILSKFFEYTGLDKVTFAVKPVIEKVIEVITNESIVLQRNNELLYKFISNSEKKQKEYQIGDFFSFYISHQSDSLGVMPLSIISKEKNFEFINTYSDMDYFINKFIDSVIIKLDPRFLKHNKDGTELDFEQFINDIFTTHLFDIYTAKLFTDFEYQEEGKTLSVLGFNHDQQGYWKDMKQAFEERNFFGVSLLSYFFAALEDQIYNKKISIYLAGNDELNEFLKELIEYAADPEKIEFVEKKDEPVLTIKLYESDGKEILNKDLHNDDFFKYVHNLMNEELNKNFKYSTVEYNNVDIPNTYIKFDKHNNKYIKLPIKMMLSLPRGKDGKVKQSLFIPYMVDNENKKNIDILTIGGAEHNRALAHLINKHRQQYKSKRIFGFLDNYFDLQNKLHYKKDIEYRQSFLMALNQPVAGYNAIFAARRDNEDGKSDAWEAKIISFIVEDKDRKFNIVSVYGFSALSSVYATHNVVASIDSMERIEEMVFNPEQQYFKEMKRNLNIEVSNLDYKKKGLAVLYRYKKIIAIDLLNNEFENKHASYIFLHDRDKYKKAFLYSEDENSIFDGEKNYGARHYI